MISLNIKLILKVESSLRTLVYFDRIKYRRNIILYTVTKSVFEGKDREIKVPLKGCLLANRQARILHTVFTKPPSRELLDVHM